MKFILQKFFYIFIYIQVIYSASKEIKSYSEIQLPKGKSEYFYIVSNFIPHSSKIPYFFIKLTDAKEIQFKIYFNNNGNDLSPLKKDIWINIPISNDIKNCKNITFEINNKIKGAKIIFIDTSQINNISIEKFLSLDLNVNKMRQKPFPLEFRIDANSNISFSIIEKVNDKIFDDDKVLSYCLEENNECKYIGIDNINLIKGKKYRFKLNCYTNNKIYYFKKLEIYAYIKEIEFKNNTFITNNFTEHDYFIINIKNYLDVYYYIKDTSGFLLNNYYITNINEEKKNNLIKDIKYMEENNNFQKIQNGKLNYINRTIFGDYLLIGIKKNGKKHIGYMSFFSKMYEINDVRKSIEIEKDTHVLINITKYYSSTAALVSNYKNMKLLYKRDHNEFTNKIVLRKSDGDIIYVDSSNDSTKFICNIFELEDKEYDYNFITENEIENFLKKCKTETFFMRMISTNEKFGFNTTYFFDINEKYYFYNKRYFGNMNIYKYSKHLDIYSKIPEFIKPVKSYDTDSYELVNNKLLIISGTQIFNYFKHYGTLYDFLLQKVNDFEYINLNPKITLYNNNFVKLLNGNKKYFINFELDYLIKLDNYFLEAKIVFVNNEGKEYILDSKNKVIENLKGNKFTVISNNNAIIYFYKKIKNFNDNGIIEFDKLKSGKNMKINISNKENYDIKIAIAKDFGFKEYYPMISYESLEILTINSKKTKSIYIENYYDLLEQDIYEDKGEKYFIYLFEIEKNNNLIFLSDKKCDISSPIYFDYASLSQGKKYKFDIISPNKSSFILKSFNKYEVNYQFIKCSNKDDIKFKIENTYGEFYEKNKIYPYEDIINRNKEINIKLNSYETLLHTFESKSEFLFLYDFSNFNSYDNFYKYKNFNFKIKSINIIDKNKLTVEFIPVYKGLNEYYIIVAKKDNENNLYSFSNPCYLSKLMINDSEKICVKQIYSKDSDVILIFEEIDISKISKNENNEYVITIISYNINKFNHLEFYTPVEYNEENTNKNAIELKLGEKMIFNSYKNYFKYEHLSDEIITVYFIFDIDKDKNIAILLSQENEEEKIIPACIDIKKIHFNKSGTYFLEFIPFENDNKNITFYTYSFKRMIDEIDLSKNIYSNFLLLKKTGLYEKFNLSYYKVKNLKEDKYVYFTFEGARNYKKYINPFIVCKNNFDECEENVFLYKFIKGNNYTIYIGLINNIDIYGYAFEKYAFFPILKNTIQKIEGEGHYIINETKIFFINTNHKLYVKVLNIIPYLISSNYKIKKEFLYNFEYYKQYSSFEITQQYAVIILIPKDNNELNQVIITTETFGDLYEYKIKAGENALIDINYENDFRIIGRDFRFISRSYLEFLISIKNNFETFSSPFDNIKFISSKKINKKSNFVFKNYGRKLLYIDKSNKDIIINRKIYEFKYVFFKILNNDISEFINDFEKYMGFSLNSRINTNHISINDLINIYIHELNIKYILYIKKYFGSINLYESKYELSNLENFSELTRPINNLEEKRSIFDRIIILDKHKLITGHITPNSFLDVYLEKDNNDPNIYASNFKNKKYLKKDIEYKIHFALNHLIKLEPGFNAEITIYNEDKEIILDKQNPTGILIGNNFKIKSNKNTMIYFYPKTKMYQKRIEPKYGKNVEIKMSNHLFTHFAIDFGFEGYGPLRTKFFESQILKNGVLYIENIYDKIETKLIEGEYLFLYYDGDYENIIKMNYINKKIYNFNNIYNFNLINKNKEKIKNELIVPYTRKRNINTKLHFYYCKGEHEIKVNFDEKEQKNFYESGNYFSYRYISDNRFTQKFSFESKEDFILSISYYDDMDKYIEKFASWIDERKELNNLTINEIKIKNSKIININFNPNYQNSTTKYIIIITPEENNKTFENLKNPCYIAELTEKKGKFIMEEIYDTGENNFIEIDIDISDIICKKNKYIVNIISQELRFEKKINFYMPKIFNLEKKINKYSKNEIMGIILFIILLILLFSFYRIKYNKKVLKMNNKEKLIKGIELNDLKE